MAKYAGHELFSYMPKYAAHELFSAKTAQFCVRISTTWQCKGNNNIFGAMSDSTRFIFLPV